MGRVLPHCQKGVVCVTVECGVVYRKNFRERRKKERRLKPCRARNTVVYGFFWHVIFINLRSHSDLLLKEEHGFQKFMHCK
jgi:hypothetical protein